MIPPVEPAAELLDLVFRKAREKARAKHFSQRGMEAARRKEALKIDSIKSNLAARLNTLLQAFPETAKLPPFYVRLMELTLDFSRFKQSMGALSWAIERSQALQKQYASRISKARTKEDIHRHTKEYYGRMSSVIHQIDNRLAYLEQCRKIMRTYPDIKEMFTICLYGFPNVGKTTLLNLLTSTRAKTAAYAFTTTSINAGYVTQGGYTIQVLDVPGTLARHKKNPIELQADLVLHELADIVVYVFDITETCGYSLTEQERLFQKIKDIKRVYVYVSKTDLKDTAIPPSFLHKSVSLDELKEGMYGAVKEKTLRENTIKNEL